MLIAIGLTAGPVHAQVSAEGTIRGVARDTQGGVLPGVTMSASSPAAPRGITTVTDAEGAYRLQSLVPGEYRVTAELQGFSRVERVGLEIRAGLNIVVDVTLQVGHVGETIEVRGETPMLESERSAKTVNISGELQRRLPLSGRKDFSDFLEITPGVTARGFDQASGGQVYMLRGTDIENHVTQVDGADMGSFRQNWAGLYMGLSTDAVADVQVKTAGADASSPLGVGLITQVATPSGTDRLKGSASFAFTSKSWNGDNSGPGESPAISEVLQPDLSVGGPLLRGKAWFFGAFRYTRRDVGISRDASQLAALEALEPTFSPFDNSSRSKYYYVKGTTQLTSKHQLYGFYQYDLNPEEANWAYSASKLYVSTFGGHGIGSRLQSVWTDRLTTKVLFAYNDKSLNGTLSAYDNYPGTGPGIEVYSSAALSGGRLAGAGQVAQLNNLFSRSAQPATKATFSADATYYLSSGGWLGNHELQTGLYVQQFGYTSTINYSNGGDAQRQAVLNSSANPAAGYTFFNRRVYDTPSVRNADVAAHDYAVYLQDAWKLTPRLTLNLGVRFDQVSATDQLFDVDVLDAWHFGPRFGVTYALTGNRTSILRGTWGRVHDIPNSTYLGTAGTQAAGYTDFFDNDLDGVFETVLPQPASSRLSSDRVIDPDRHQPFIDEWLAGFQQQFPGQMSVDVSWVHRAYKDRPALVEINGIYDGGVFSGVRDESQNLIYRVTNNIWNSFVYNGFEVTVAKRTAKTQLLGSYSRNFQHLDGTWQPNDPASFIQPDAFPNDRGLGTIRGNETNSLSGTSDTRSPSWQKHTLRVGGSYFLPWGLVASGNLTIMSGPYTGPVVERLDAADPRFGPPTLRLSNGRTIANPLSTTIRFVGPTRGDGQLEADPLSMLNLRVGKDFKLGEDRLEIAFDVLNALNGDTFQQFKSGGNQTYNANYGIAADGTMQGQSRQFARSGQLSVRFAF
jgi:outer membrane receptor protein involved in Fe transport